MQNKESKENKILDKISLLAPRRWMLLLIDTLIISVAYGIMNLISFLSVSSMILQGKLGIGKFMFFYFFVILLRFIFGIYTCIWRYADTKTYLKLIISDFLAGLLYFCVGRWMISSVYIGFSYTFAMLMLIMIATLVSRFLYQQLYAFQGLMSDNAELKNDLQGESKQGKLHQINIAIVGAGNVGATLAGELLRNPKSHYKPLCFIDKDTRKIGYDINGIKIYPEDKHIVERIQGMPIQEIVIALPDASAEEKKYLYDLYKPTGCKVKLYDYPLGDKLGEKSEDSGKRGLREFSIEDLLFRDVLHIKSRKTKEFYKDKTVLVTGGGGSIGSELCRQIAKLGPRKLIILDIYENNAYDIQQELIRKYGEKLDLEVIIASVRDEKRINEIFDEIRPQIVFHAAAHKHVPLMEHSGIEAIKNNVFGTYNVANAAEKYGVEKFLLISTDKAVNPTNIMGASKRLCEMIIQCRKDSKTEYTAVRFGNVLGSNGSVIPLFKRQIAAGGPITLTDKRIIRYFMTIPEAVGLVMETCAMAKNGELFVLDMGKPVKILDLAENMITLSGLRPYEDIDIVEVGLRPGEKLYEELLMKSEDLDKTDNEMIFIERDKGLTRDEMEQKLLLLRSLLFGNQDTSKMNLNSFEYHQLVIEAIKETVPTYHSPEEINETAEASQEMIIAMTNS